MVLGLKTVVWCVSITSSCRKYDNTRDHVGQRVGIAVPLTEHEITQFLIFSN